jgi:hypothetical protein
MTPRRILRTEAAAARKGCNWLIAMPSNQLRTEHHIQRLFAVSTVSAAHPIVSGVAGMNLRQLAGAVPAFVWHRCPADPFFAIAACRLLARRSVELASLEELKKGLRTVLFGDEQNAAATRLWADLLLEKRRGDLPGMPESKLPELGTILDGNREALIEACRVLMHESSCGTVPVAAAHLVGALPMLCVSYARSFDIQMVCRLLRSCAYLGISETIQCIWAREWLLHQQHPDGRFGLLEVEASRAGRNLDALDLQFVCTIEAIWTLAELACPGVIVRGASKLLARTVRRSKLQMANSELWHSPKPSLAGDA